MNPKSSGDGKAISTRIAVLLLVPGVLSLMFSILYESQVPAFVGLGLVFWGALFLLIRPVKYVTGNVVYSSAISSYSTIDRIIKDYGYKGAAYYIPPYPKDVYLPEHLKGLKEPVVFLSATQDSTMPSIEEIAGSKFRLEVSKGLLIVSPGSGLLSQIEKELNVDFAKMKPTELCETLPRVVSENLKPDKRNGVTSRRDWFSDETLRFLVQEPLQQGDWFKKHRPSRLPSCERCGVRSCQIIG